MTGTALGSVLWVWGEASEPALREVTYWKGERNECPHQENVIVLLITPNELPAWEPDWFFFMVVSYYTCFHSDHYMQPKIILTWLAPSCHSNLDLNVPKCFHLMWPRSLPIPLSSLIVPMAFSCAWPFLVLFNCPLLGVDCLTTPVLRPWAGTGSSRSVAQMNK